MKIRIFGINIHIHFLFTAVVSALLCIDRSSIALYSLLSVMIHEAGHIIAIFCVGGRPGSVHLSACGVLIHSDLSDLNVCRRIFVAVSGPIANLLPIMLLNSSYFRTAMLINGLFNLLPVTGTDGGDILMCLLSLIKNRRAAGLTVKCFDHTVIAAALILGIAAVVESGNPTLLLAGVYFVIMIVSSAG